MKFSQRTVALAAAIGLLVASGAFARQTPAPAAPAAPAAPRKLISPIRGEASVEITKPDTKVAGGEVVTVILVRNTSTSPIAGLKIEENWYDKGGTPVGGDIYRHPKPFMPDEVIKVTLKTPKNDRMKSNQYLFSHANGAVKPKTVPKLTPTATS